MSDGSLSQQEIDAFLGGGSYQPGRLDQEVSDLASLRDRFWPRLVEDAAGGLLAETRRTAWQILQTALELLTRSGRLGLLALPMELDQLRAKPVEVPEYFLDWCHRIAGMNGEAGIGPDELLDLVGSEIDRAQSGEVALVVMSALGAQAIMGGVLPEALTEASRPVFALGSAGVAAQGPAVEQAVGEEVPAWVSRRQNVGYDFNQLGFWRENVPVPVQSDSDPDLWYFVDTNMTFLRFDNRTGALTGATPLDGVIPEDHWQLHRAWDLVPAPSFAYDELRDRLYLGRPSFALPGAVTADTDDQDLYDPTWYLEAWETASPRLLWRMEVPAAPKALEVTGNDQVRVGLDNHGVVDVADGKTVRQFAAPECGRLRDGVHHWDGYSLFGFATGLHFISQDGGEHHHVSFPDDRPVDIISIGVREDAILVSTFDRRVIHLSGEGTPWSGWEFTSIPRWFLFALAPEADWAVGMTTSDRSQNGVWFDERRFFPAGEMEQLTWAVTSSFDPETLAAAYSPATTTRGLPVVPQPLRHGRLALAAVGTAGVVLHHGRRGEELGEIHGQAYPATPPKAFTHPEGDLAALYGGPTGAIVILNGEGHTVAGSAGAFASPQEIFRIDPERKSVEVFGRSAVSTTKLGANPRQETWRWYWEEDRWERTGFPFEGFAHTLEGAPQVFFRDAMEPFLVGEDPGFQVTLRADLATGSIWALAQDVTRLDIHTREQERFPVHLPAYGLRWDQATAVLDHHQRRCWVLGRDGDLLAFDMTAGALLWRATVSPEDSNLEGRLALLQVPADDRTSTLAVRTRVGVDLFNPESGTRLRRLVTDGETGPLTSVPFSLAGRIYAYAGAALVCWE